jgi:hypothetical protein
LEKIQGYHAMEAYKKAVRKWQVWVEPLFAEAKDWHGLRRLRLRGLMNANIQGLLIAAGQNLKRLLAPTGWGRRHGPCGSLVALPRMPWRLGGSYGESAARPGLSDGRCSKVGSPPSVRGKEKPFFNALAYYRPHQTSGQIARWGIRHTMRRIGLLPDGNIAHGRLYHRAPARMPAHPT